MDGTNLISLTQLRKVYYTAYASFPSAGLNVGDLAYATDRLVFYRWSGSAWQNISLYTSSGTAAAIPAAADLPNGSLYYETDTTLLKQVQAGAWAAVVNPPSYGSTKEMSWFVTYPDSAMAPGQVVGTDVVNGQSGYCNFFVPHDFTAIDVFEAIVIGKDTNASADIDVYSSYGAFGASYGEHTEQDLVSTFNLTTSQFSNLDISAAGSGLSALDTGSIRLWCKDVTSEFYYIGLRLKYT